MSIVELPTEQVAIPREQRFVLRNVDWQEYRAIAAALGERHLRLAYDGESLELMTVSRLHDQFSRLLGRFLVVLTEELDMPIASIGSTTLDREEAERALEPDECFYLHREALVRDRDDLDLDTDPPPDLGVEIDVSRSSLNRLGIYAKLGIPEVWRFNGENLRIYRLTADGTYAPTERSFHFPMLPVKPMVEFLKRRSEMEENSLVKSFRAWVREQIASGWQEPQE